VTDGNPRYPSLPLMIGLIVLPIVFFWFLLRRGYASSTRNAAFAYTFTFPVLTLLSHACFGGAS
jgi:hypothetical protein